QTAPPNATAHPKHSSHNDSPRGGGVWLDGALDDGVDLDELTGESEDGDTEQGRRGNVVIELAADLLPGCDEVAVRADDVDRQLMDVVALEAMVGDEGEEVAEALGGLRGRIVRPDDRSLTVDRNLAGHEQAPTDTVGVAVVRRLCKAGAQLALVHHHPGDTRSTARPDACEIRRSRRWGARRTAQAHRCWQRRRRRRGDPSGRCDTRDAVIRRGGTPDILRRPSIATTSPRPRSGRRRDRD